MAQLDDVIAQIQAAVTGIASRLNTALAGEDAAVATRLQPFADELTTLATDPTQAATGTDSSTDGATGDASTPTT